MTNNDLKIQPRNGRERRGCDGLRIFAVCALVVSGLYAQGGAEDTGPHGFAIASSSQTGKVGPLVKAAVTAGYWAARPDTSVPTGWKSGPVYRIRSVSTRDERGAPVAGFDGKAWEDDRADSATLAGIPLSLRDHLARDGFVFAEIRTILAADTTGAPAVDVTLHASRGAAFKTGEPVLRGTRTRPAVALRLALLGEDDNFDPARLGMGLARLGRLGYFDEVKHEGLYRDSLRHVLYPVVRLTDARANTIGGLLGYDTEGQDGGRLTGFLDVHLVNMRGTARDLTFSYDGRTAREREVRGSYTEPWLFSLPVGARWEGRFLQQDTAFQEWQQSVFLFRDLDFTSRVEAEAGAQANHDRIADVRTTAYLSGVRVLFDIRDRAPFTRDGWRGHFGVTGVQRTLQADSGADSSYYLARLQASAEHWIPVTDRLGLKGGVSAATNLPLNRLNPGELYDVGGARSLRGYRERQFRTNAYVLGDAEIQWSVGRRGRLFAFASPGLVNRPVERYDFTRVLGYGTGLEIAQGDWSVSLAYALSPERPLGNGFLHVAVENRF